MIRRGWLEDDWIRLEGNSLKMIARRSGKIDRSIRIRYRPSSGRESGGLETKKNNDGMRTNERISVSLVHESTDPLL